MIKSQYYTTYIYKKHKLDGENGQYKTIDVRKTVLYSPLVCIVR